MIITIMTMRTIMATSTDEHHDHDHHDHGHHKHDHKHD